MEYQAILWMVLINYNIIKSYIKIRYMDLMSYRLCDFFSIVYVANRQMHPLL